MNNDTIINRKLTVTYGRLKEDYFDNRLSLRELAAKYKCTYNQAKHLVESAKIRKTTKVAILYDAFKEVSNATAYIAGFFAADGSIRKDGALVCLSTNIKDVYIHDLVRKYIGGSTKQYRYAPGKNGWKLVTNVCSVEIVKDLEKTYNIVPQKTHVLEFPVGLENTTLKLFMRGFFDGDGCITTSNTRGRLKVSMYCASESFIAQYMKEIENHVNIKVPKLYDHPCGGQEFTLGIAKGILFLHWLYSNFQELALPRKLRRYQNWVN